MTSLHQGGSRSYKPAVHLFIPREKEHRMGRTHGSLNHQIKHLPFYGIMTKREALLLEICMKANEIRTYLAQLGQELTKEGVQQPMHVLLIGGAYMLLLVNAPRSTDDVDIFWLEEDPTLEQTIDALREGIEAVAEKNKLEIDWFNYMTHLLLSDQVIIPGGKLWKRFGPLHIHVPPKEYILALKILAGREKDLGDCEILLQNMKVKTRAQAQRLLDRYIPSSTQSINAQEIGRSLDELFGEA